MAKTSHGTFYLYFSSKEDLFLALLTDVGREMTALSEALPPIGPGQSGYDALRGWLARFYDLYDHYHPVIQAWMDDRIERPAWTWRRLGAGTLNGFLRTIIERLSEVDPPSVGDIETAALAMVAMVERFGFYAVNHLQPLDRDVTLDTLATILHNGLFGAGRRRRAMTVGARVHHSAVVCSDVELSLRFYRDGLGMDVLMDEVFEGDWPTLFAARSTRLRSIFLGSAGDASSGIVELVVLDAEPAPADRPRRTASSCSRSMSTSRRRWPVSPAFGVQAEGRTAMATPGGEVLMATVRDPDGVLIELIGVPA